MGPVFETRRWDAAGRLGELSIPRSGLTVETPALLPVVNPNVQSIEPARLADEFGAQMLITNAYILHGSEEFRATALDVGIHDLLGFDGAVMTDSGSFQLAEYGEIDVTTEEILEFQRAIGSDVATPVDIPTPPDADRDRAEADLAETQRRIETAAAFDAGEMLVTAPIQGSTHPDLRERAAREAAASGLDVYPVGAMVPLLTDYRFGAVVEAVAAAKRGLGADAPVHLFGAGHPIAFALAVALGCDLFDSAAYALYAREGRYLTVEGTERLDDLEVLPCECPVCARTDPAALAGADGAARDRCLAEHNLYVSFGEIRRVRQAIRDGDLLELVEARARAHPGLLDGYRALLEHADALDRHDPARKNAFFYLSAESARRPEVARHHDRLGRLEAPGRVLLAREPGAAEADGVDAVWGLKPPFGPYPRPLGETYPVTAEVPDRLDAAAWRAAAAGVDRLVEANPSTALSLDPAGVPEVAIEAMPEAVSVRSTD